MIWHMKTLWLQNRACTLTARGNPQSPSPLAEVSSMRVT
jgi:hypothetical protein